MAEKQQSVIISIPTAYDATMREAIGTEIVNFIIDRTRQGLDRYNKPFKSYSPAYVSSTEFKAAGKSKSRVNLRLSGEMHSGLTVLGHGRGYIKVGFESGTDENDKAAWTSRAERGGRDMLGIMPKDLRRILDKYPTQSQETTSIFASIANEVLRRAIEE